ncbi:MAG: hypothetical protein ACYCZZ_00795 [Minisyncoccota bacterium]
MNTSLQNIVTLAFFAAIFITLFMLATSGKSRLERGSLFVFGLLFLAAFTSLSIVSAPGYVPTKDRALVEKVLKREVVCIPERNYGREKPNTGYERGKKDQKHI